jgi:GNAT superfamily N-acetyltransferase
MTDYTSPRVVIRPALPKDKADVAEFTKFIWDGHDYVGMVFPHWLEDPQGQLLVAEYGGKCVGTAKVSLVAPGQWWLEGFRVDPEYQGQRIGSQLDAACNEWWDEHGGGMLRLMTNSKRVKVHHLSEARGFKRIGEVFAYEAEPLAEPTDAFTLLEPEDANEAVALCDQFMPGGMMGIGWKFLSPAPTALYAAAKEGFAWWWRGRSGVLSAWQDDDERGKFLSLGLGVCEVDERVRLLMDYRRLASLRGEVTVSWMGVVNEPIREALITAGYHSTWEDGGYLYEREHAR